MPKVTYSRRRPQRLGCWGTRDGQRTTLPNLSSQPQWYPPRRCVPSVLASDVRLGWGAMTVTAAPLRVSARAIEALVRADTTTSGGNTALTMEKTSLVHKPASQAGFPSASASPSKHSDLAPGATPCVGSRSAPFTSYPAVPSEALRESARRYGIWPSSSPRRRHPQEFVATLRPVALDAEDDGSSAVSLRSTPRGSD